MTIFWLYVQCVDMFCSSCCIYYKVQNNELAIDETPSRALMWRKARENKNGEYKNADVKVIADELVSLTPNIFMLKKTSNHILWAFFYRSIMKSKLRMEP